MAKSSTGEVTRLLREWGQGHQEAESQLLPLVYRQLRLQAERYLSRERRGHTLQTTDLIHEAYLRLCGQDRVRWRDRGHFFAVAATAMRRVLVDHARRQEAGKRPGAGDRVWLDGVTLGAINAAPLGAINAAPGLELLDLDAALTRLGSLDPRAARIVELRFFAGLTLEETAEALTVSVRTVTREWGLAKVWLRHQLEPAG